MSWSHLSSASAKASASWWENTDKAI